MKDITPDICDKHEDKVTSLDLPLHTFGNKSAFWGEIVTVRCYHDNSKVRETLSQDGKGKVLIVDGHGSCQKALLGDQLAILAIDNNWEGVIVYGAIVMRLQWRRWNWESRRSGPAHLKRKSVGRVTRM